MITVPKPFGVIVGPAKLERLHVSPDESRTTYDCRVTDVLPVFWRMRDRLVSLMNWWLLRFRVSGGGATGSMTVRLITVEWVLEPEVPVTVIL